MFLRISLLYMAIEDGRSVFHAGEQARAQLEALNARSMPADPRSDPVFTAASSPPGSATLSRNCACQSLSTGNLSGCANPGRISSNRR